MTRVAASCTVLSPSANVFFNVACLYAPNRNPARDHFFIYVLDVVNFDPPMILCGDFNTVFDRGLDRSGSDVDDSSRESTPLLTPDVAKSEIKGLTVTYCKNRAARLRSRHELLVRLVSHLKGRVDGGH